MTDSSPAVHVENLTRRFGARTAVDRLGFDVRPGELFGLIGPDGAGKTTTLRMLTGVLRPDDGDIVIHGTSVVRNPEGVKQDVAYMSQRFGLYADLTVRENLLFYADLYQVPGAEREAQLERLFRFSNLGPFQGRPAGDLSGGMKQKLGLSCALIHRPRVLLLDEPTFGVDPISRRDLWLIIHGMVARGVTAVVSTAYMDEAERFDRVLLLHQGRCLRLDTPDALRRGLPGDLLEIGVEDPRRARDVVLRHPAVRRATIFGDRLHVSVPSAADRGAVTAALRDAGFAVRAAKVVLPSMEDVVMAYMAEAS